VPCHPLHTYVYGPAPAGTLLQQSLQLALLKYSFEDAAPCTVQLQRHLLCTAGVYKGPTPEEEAAIVSVAFCTGGVHKGHTSKGCVEGAHARGGGCGCECCLLHGRRAQGPYVQEVGLLETTAEKETGRRKC